MKSQPRSQKIALLSSRPHRAALLSLSQRLNWMEEIFVRIRGARKIKAALASVREPSWRRDFAATTLRATLLEGMSSSLFELGIPECSTAVAEAIRRLRTHFAAPGFELRDLREWFLSAIRNEDPAWTRELSLGTVSEMISLLQDGDVLSEDELLWIRRAMVDAILSLALDLQTIHSSGSNVMFYALDFQLISRRSHASDERLQAAAEKLRAEIISCRASLEDSSTPKAGGEKLSSWQIQRGELILDRVEILLSVLCAKTPLEQASGIQKTVLALMEGALTDRDYRSAYRHYSSVLSGELAEQLGHVGEHYIVRNTQEYLSLFWKAGGAGLVTVGTIVAKFVVGSLGLGLFVAGAATSLNYVMSFLIMQVLGFRLATKQPSLTASALVGRLKLTRLHSQKALSEASNEIAAIAQSQVAAALGNFALVIPATIVFHFVYRWSHGRNFLSDASAFHVLESMHPLKTLTIPFAILTGVLLWLSTVLAGLVERWALARGWSRHHARTLFGVGSCVSLGALLAIAPLLGTASGLPLDVRHFTLSTGSMAMAVCSLGFSKAFLHGFLACALGVLVIGILNFGVSFALSLSWSAFARGVRRAHLVQVFSLALKNRRFPSHFIYPLADFSLPEA